ncbi:MAG: YqgE/AlgH family protein [Gammaproteobacteria bacterium]
MVQIKDASSQYDFLTNHFLIAMPQLRDLHFSHALTYICEHNDTGALGIIVNRPLHVTLKEVIDHVGIEFDDNLNRQQNPISDWVFSGGPVQTERGFVLHSNDKTWESSLAISKDIALTTSQDILKAVANNEGPNQFLVALGYAGWGAGQLEREVAQNAWLTVPANPDIIFKTPIEQRWNAAAVPLGIDLNLMSSSIGHA